jgi:hypothetical protein
MDEPLVTNASAQCPYCGEVVEPALDPLGPSEEEYVEDCPVCCRPWRVHVQRSDEGVEVWLAREDD